MRDYCARPIPHLKGLNRVLVLRKQDAGLCDCLFVQDAGKFRSGYDMAASQEIAPHALASGLVAPGGGGRGMVAPFAIPCHAAEYTHARRAIDRVGELYALIPKASPPGKINTPGDIYLSLRQQGRRPHLMPQPWPV